MQTLPESYNWLNNEILPPVIAEALKYYGVKEFEGEADNPIIINWGKEIGHQEYKHDDRAWCALFVAYVVYKTGEEIPRECLKSFDWLEFGELSEIPKFGDILIYQKKDHGHIGFYIGETENTYHTLGGNQEGEVNIAKMWKNEFYMARTPKNNKTFTNLRPIHLMKDGSMTEG